MGPCLLHACSRACSVHTVGISGSDFWFRNFWFLSDFLGPSSAGISGSNSDDELSKEVNRYLPL